MQKTIQRRAGQVISSLLALLMLFSLTGCLPHMLYELLQTAETQPVEVNPPVYESSGRFLDYSLEDLLEVLFEHEVCDDNLTLNQCLSDPAALGIAIPRPATLGDYSLEGVQADNQFYTEILAALSGSHVFDLNQLSGQQLREASYIQSILEQTIRYEAFFYYGTPLSPSTGAQASLPLALMDYSFRTPEDIEIYLEVLEDFPRYFGQLLAFETEKTRLGLAMPAESIADSIDEALAYTGSTDSYVLVESFDEMLDNAVAAAHASGEDLALASLDPSQIDAFKERNREALDKYVIPAYVMLVEGLRTIQPNCQAGTRLYDYPLGRQYYELRMEIQGFAQSPLEAARTLDQSLEENWAVFMDNYDAYAADTSLENAVRALGKDPEAYIEFIRAHAGADFPSFEELNYSIRVAPEASPNDYAMAYFLIPPVDDNQQNSIVFFPRNISDDVDLYNTTAHEGYPGHMYQFFAYSLVEPSNICKLLGCTAYIEGWAMYSQSIAMDYLGANPAAVEAYNAYDRFAYGLQARVDIGINYEGWTLDDTSRFLAQWGLQYAANGIYTTNIQQPVAYLPYGLGLIKFWDLRNAAEAELGSRFDPVAYHEQITSLGPVAFDVLDAEMSAWLRDSRGTLV